MTSAPRAIIDEGIALARGILGASITPAFAPLDFVQAWERLRANEARMEACRWKLIALDAAGVATAADFTGYDKTRHALYAGTRRLTDPFRAWIAQHRPDLLARLPVPQLWPDVAPGSGRMYQAAELQRQVDAAAHTAAAITDGGGAGGPLATRGLGDAGISAGALVIIGIIGVAIIVAGIALTAMMVRDQLISEDQTRQLEECYRSRRAIYDECVHSGGDGGACIATAARLAPTPSDALVDVPQPGEGWGWVPWALGALAATVAIGGAIYVYRQERGKWLRDITPAFAGAPRHLADSTFRPAKLRAKPGRRARRRYDLEVE